MKCLMIIFNDISTISSSDTMVLDIIYTNDFLYGMKMTSKNIKFLILKAILFGKRM